MFSFPLNPIFHLKYSNGFMIKIQSIQSGEFITILNLETLESFQLKIMGNLHISYVDIVKDSIIICENSQILVVNYKTKEQKMYQGNIEKICQLNGQEVVVYFACGKLRLFGNTDWEINLELKNIFYVDSHVFLVISDGDLVYVINKADGTVTKIIDVPSKMKINTIGLNEDTYQIFLGSTKGQICILD